MTFFIKKSLHFFFCFLPGGNEHAFCRSFNFLFITFARMMTLKNSNNYTKRGILCLGRYEVQGLDTKVVKKAQMLLLSTRGNRHEHCQCPLWGDLSTQPETDSKGKKSIWKLLILFQRHTLQMLQINWTAPRQPPCAPCPQVSSSCLRPSAWGSQTFIPR